METEQSPSGIAQTYLGIKTMIKEVDEDGEYLVMYITLDGIRSTLFDCFLDLNLNSRFVWVLVGIFIKVF